MLIEEERKKAAGEEPACVKDRNNYRKNSRKFHPDRNSGCAANYAKGLFDRWDKVCQTIQQAETKVSGLANNITPEPEEKILSLPSPQPSQPDLPGGLDLPDNGVIRIPVDPADPVNPDTPNNDNVLRLQDQPEPTPEPPNPVNPPVVSDSGEGKQ